MEFLQEKRQRNFCVFLVSVCLALACFLGICGFLALKSPGRALARQEMTASSYLLEQGVPPELIARAWNHGDVTPQGRELVEKIGQAGHVQGELLLYARQTSLAFVFLLFFGGLIFPAVILWGAGVFLAGREKMYEDAEYVVKGYANRQFGMHLPWGETGALYRLFEQVEQLALSLEAECEAEHGAKEFLKDMISDISHQLKTPLAALEMYVEILGEEPGEEETVRQFSEKSARSLERMEQLISSLLKMARLDAGTIVFEKRSCFVSEVVNQALGELLERGNREGKEILVEGDKEEMLFCDIEWTKEALGNLLKNALDHTEKGDVIGISWKTSPAMLRLTVRDEGCGIAPEDIHHIFKRFYRSRKSSDTLGVGIGLSLAKSIVEGQGGILSVESRQGEGTAFHMSFLTKS